jgi:hypothetical protein
MNDAHTDLEIRCYNETGETNEYGNPETCETTVTYEDDYSGMVSKRGYEGRILRLRCPECNMAHDVCPVCHGGGWFRGESTGEMLACHVCNQAEYAAQMADPYF